MSRLTMRGSLGWCASARTPPATIALAEVRVNVDPVTVIELAPRPTPDACALASLPMPSAVCPRLTNWSPEKVMVFAADTWTAAGIWYQFGRVASNWMQPDRHAVIAGHDQFPAMYAPVCWSTKPWLLLGPSQLVPLKVTPLNAMWCAGASYVPPMSTRDCSVGNSTVTVLMFCPDSG